MKSLNLRGKQSKNCKYHFYKGEVGNAADNLLHRDFHADKPFEKQTTDITENFSQIKRNEPGSIQSSFACNLIFVFV